MAPAASYPNHRSQIRATRSRGTRLRGSLDAGGGDFLTAAARSGASVFKMREVSRHKSMQVLADYVRDAELFRDHAGEGFL